MTTLPQTAPVRMPRPVVPTQLPMHSASQQGTSLSTRDAGSSGGTPGLTAHDMWRIVRGNIWLIIIMVLVSGVAGYGVNSYLARYHSQYTAKGYVLVRGQGELPRPGIEIREPQPSEIELLQNTQTAMLTHEGLFMEAIQNPESRIRRTKWFQEFGQQNLDLAKEDLAKKFRVTPKPGSKLIQVEMTFSDPDDTKVIVEDMVFEHIKNVKDAQVKQDQDKVKLLGRELAMVKIELDTEVSPHILAKEKDLGADEVATFTIYNGKQIQLDRLSMERSRIAGELSGVKARLQTLVRDLEEGRTPAEVEREIHRTGRYVQARAQVDDIDIMIEQLTRKYGVSHDVVISRKQLRATLQAKVDEIREELKSNYAEIMKNELRNDEMATEANGGRVDRMMDEVSKQLSDLNQKMSEYKTLKDREKELRERIRDLNEEMTKINQFHINAPWASAEWGSRPQKPDRPSFPKLPYTMGVALALGLALSLGIAFLREMTDTSVRSPRDIARVGQMNLLGMIPHDADDPQSAGARLPLVIFDAPHSIEAEAFRQVRTRLQHSASLDTVRSILVTSPSTGDGKTTVACNLAASLAQNGRRILLVDANFRKPQLHAVFGVANDQGLSDALQDPDGLGSYVRETEVPNLSVMTSGPKPANATELLESQLQTDFIERALEEFDHVIFDSGPLLMVADSIALAPRVDGVVTVVRARGNSRGLLMRMRDELKTLKAEHLGVILNAVRAQGGGYYGRNIQAYYRYQNEE